MCLIPRKCKKNRLMRNSLISSLPASNERIFFSPEESLLCKHSEQTKPRNLTGRGTLEGQNRNIILELCPYAIFRYFK